jgi:hypothetical protein
LSTAYHLARAGRMDVQVLERNGKPSGETTTRAAGLVGQIRATPLMRRAIRYAIDVRHPGRAHPPGLRRRSVALGKARCYPRTSQARVWIFRSFQLLWVV